MKQEKQKIRVEAHLTVEEFEIFSALASSKDWSKKKLAENIIRQYLAAALKRKVG